MMSFKETNSQLEALAYINDVLAQENMEYRIGGHSKGGNLAVYACAKCKPNLQNKILKIYDNDGPGLCKEIIQDNLLKSIKNRIRRIVPEYSVIGMLFEHEVPFQIVKSSEKGLNQHNAFSWQVEGDKFITCEELDPKAGHLNRILDRWMEKEDLEHRTIFVEQVFNAMEVTGAEYIDEIAGGLDNIERVVAEILYSDRKTKKVIHNLFRTTIESIKKIDFIDFLHKGKSFAGMIMIVFGLLLFVLPDEGFQVMGTGFVFVIFVFSIIRLGHLVKEKGKHGNKNLCLSLLYIPVVLLLILFAYHASILKLSINFILGITIFIYGVVKLKKILKNIAVNMDVIKLLWLQSGTSIIVGLAVLGIPYYYVEKNLYVIGLYIIILGLTEFIYNADKSNKHSRNKYNYKAL